MFINTIIDMLEDSVTNLDSKDDDYEYALGEALMVLKEFHIKFDQLTAKVELDVSLNLVEQCNNITL